MKERRDFSRGGGKRREGLKIERGTSTRGGSTYWSVRANSQLLRSFHEQSRSSLAFLVAISLWMLADAESAQLASAVTLVIVLHAYTKLDWEVTYTRAYVSIVFIGPRVICVTGSCWSNHSTQSYNLLGSESVRGGPNRLLVDPWSNHWSNHWYDFVFPVFLFYFLPLSSGNNSTIVSWNW